MSAPSIDIRDILLAEDLSLIETGDDKNIGVGFEPSKPNNFVTVFDTPGFPPDLTLDKDEIYERPAVSIRVRNSDYQTGWNLVSAIKSALHGRSRETWNGSFYSVIVCSGEPFLLDWDENARARFVANFEIQRS